jgi:MSHA pilin protein MshA
MSKSARSVAKRGAQGGFTLIELVVVIVILGILSAFAVPRFARLDGQARQASVRGLEGSVRSGAMLARSVWMAAGTNPATVNLDGSNVAMVNGYPTRDSIRAALAEGSIVNSNIATAGRFREIDVGNDRVQFQLNGARDPATCWVQYIQPANANAAPTISANPNGC